MLTILKTYHTEHQCFLCTTWGPDFKWCKVFKNTHKHSSQSRAHKMCSKAWCSVSNTLFICSYRCLLGVNTDKHHPPLWHDHHIPSCWSLFRSWCLCFWDVGCYDLVEMWGNRKTEQKVDDEAFLHVAGWRWQWATFSYCRHWSIDNIFFLFSLTFT